jgi:lipoprotein-anchoring transpeptidase ErfK/SrfK
MRRICLSALLLGALCLPAAADPLQLNPDFYAASGGQNAPAPTAPRAPAPVVVAAAQPNLGGGFIQFLFGGAQQSPPVPTASQSAAVGAVLPAFAAPAGPVAPQQATALANDPDTASAANADPEHPPLDPQYERQFVAYDGKEQPGTIIIDTPHKFLYLVEGSGKALRYGIGVGRPGFTWSGVKTITAKHEWPDWRPPEAMLVRQPQLPRFMAGGPQNPLGARAMYLGSTDYRIHGSNEPWTIGHNVSSGCIRLRNADVIDLYNRVKVGTKVVVM